MTFEFFEALDTGRARTNNEDSVTLDEAVALAVLADGMGGYNAGEVASGMATALQAGLPEIIFAGSGAPLPETSPGPPRRD